MSWGQWRAQEAQVNDVGVVKVPLLPAPSFKLDTETIYNALSEQSNIKMVCICSPGNPTGSTVRKEDVNKILAHPTWNGVVILDETYIDYSSKTTSLAEWVTEWQNLVIVQTLSKSFGMAGIRQVWRASIRGDASRPPAPQPQHNLQHPEPNPLVIMADNVAKTAAQRNRLIRDMTQIKGVGRLRGGTEANFLLFEILDQYGQPSNAAACAVYKCLLNKRGIVTRFRGEDHGCHGCLRITIGTEDEMASFLQALNLTLKEVHKTGSSSGARGGGVVNGNGLNWPQEQKPGQHQTS
ncbi:histidinol-phosphate/aromatic aminotransferase and cobyric acid decarboxylase [Metarhizium robertsii]|nr:histidinol-phosphate/aromatic aminotransferase and cobyric acid decarboxylase [Metarhizium robertsii]